MARQERGLFRMIITNFVNSLRPQNGKRVLVGEDYFGTKYYEVPKAGLSNRKRPSRYFEPVEKEDHTQELPAEWEAWLRYRRKDPPTNEEIEASYKLAVQKKKNALIIEEKFALGASKQLDVPVAKRGPESFPKYEEYENFGQNYKPKIK